MKLSCVEATVVHPPEGAAGGIPIVEIRTDSGLSGWGEARATRAPDAVVDIVRDLLSPILRGRSFRGDREEIESLWDCMYGVMRAEGQTGGFTPEAIGAVDIALWDLAGKVQNKSVHQIAGNSEGAAEVKAFASLAAAPAEVLADAAARLRTAGFDVFEVIHNGSERDLIAALDLLKESLKEGERIAVNARWRLRPSWDFSFERQIDQRGPLWLANPLPPEDPFAHGRLSKAMCTPLALGECYHTHYELAPFFHELAVGVLQVDLGRCGLSEAFRMAETARNRNIPVVVRVGATVGPQLAAALQFAASAPDRRVEYNRGRLKATNAVLTSPIELKQGKYQVTAAAGLGIGIEEAELHLMETQVA
jgi:L-alanine-DL-glutamate epimerase-like enolase superfamily enzyme